VAQESRGYSPPLVAWLMLSTAVRASIVHMQFILPAFGKCWSKDTYVSTGSVPVA
jgi:hypothetical protein